MSAIILMGLAAETTSGGFATTDASTTGRPNTGSMNGEPILTNTRYVNMEITSSPLNGKHLSIDLQKYPSS